MYYQYFRNEVGARLYFHRRLWFCARGEHVWLLGGGMCGCQAEACVVAGDMHCCQGACVIVGACMVAGGMHGCWGHTWSLGGGACMGYNEIRSMSGQYASYWNAFLFILVIRITYMIFESGNYGKTEMFTYEYALPSEVLTLCGRIWRSKRDVKELSSCRL